MSKKLLLLGGGHAEIPLIQAAQKLGYFVITTGNAREGLGHAYADKNVFEDFSDHEKMLSLAKAEGVDRVCSGCNDFALLSTAYVCEKLGLPGHDSYETSLQLHHKDKYRALATRLNIPTPKAITVRNTEEFETALKTLSFPIIVKPVDLTGGKGIHRAASAEEARAAYADALSRTREDHVVVEEFVVGTNHGFSAYLQNQKVVFYFADNEQYFLNKYMVSGANTPTTTSLRGQRLLCEYSERIAKELKLVDGILHIQYIEKSDGTPVIIEICRRPPGDLYIKFVQYATGVDYPKMLIQAETGEACTEILPPLGTLPKPFLRHCIMAEKKGFAQSVYFAPEIEKNIVEKFLWYKKGEPITDPLYYKAGIVFMQFSTLEEMQSLTEKMTDLVKVDN
jgi:biotin carboxylase